ncbi:HCP-like protein [Backusella circina FSU 941]|nr:HCP-like protein [Backusella circina FSU 941]
MTFPEVDLLKLAQDPITYLKLGYYYFYSTHLENNCQQAFKAIQQSAEQGNPDAQFWIADLYSLGQGTQQSNTYAYHYYTKAAIQGCENALIRLRRLYHDEIMLYCPGVLNEIEEKQIPFKKRGTPYSTKKLYDFRTKHIGSNSVKNSLIEYFCAMFVRYQCCDLLDDNGDNETQTNLAFLYHHGYGIAKDIKQAIELYTKAAKRGYVDAQYNLACLYQTEMMEEGFKCEQALRYYSAAANGGHIAAQKYLDYLVQHGFRIDCGINVDANYKSISITNTLYIISTSTKEWLFTKLSDDISIINGSAHVDKANTLSKRALSGDKYAMHQVGLNYYYKSDGFPHNQSIGCEWIKIAAKLGLDDAQLFIGEIYKQDDIFEQNYFKASIWFRRAKQKKAKFQLGLLYDLGLGVERNVEEAKALMEESVDNSTAFQLGLFYFYNDYYTDALHMFEACAQRGDIEAMYRIKDMYWKGQGIGKDVQKAFQLLEYTANWGNTKSQLILASLYTRGHYIDRNIAKATANYFLAAEAGDPFGKYQIAMRYLSGVNVGQDYMKAFHLLQESVNQGCEQAIKLLNVPPNIDHYNVDRTNILDMFLLVTEHHSASMEYNIGCIYEKRVNRQLDTIQGRLNATNAIHWYTLAANKNNASAQYRLGLLFEEGKIIEMDLPRASSYYRMALSSRHCDAIFRLGCMYIDGRGVEQDLIKAYHLFNDALGMGHKQAKDIIELQSYIKSNKYTTYIRNTIVIVQISDTNNIKMMETVASENTAVQYQLGGLFRFREPTRALFWYEKAAKGGIDDAYYIMGLMYEDGREGIKQDYLKSSQMYHLCISKDHPEALYHLGQLYQYGRGVERDYTKAYHLYKKAVELKDGGDFKVLNRTKKSNINPRNRYSDCYYEKFNDSILMWEHLAQQGNTQAQYELGVAYQLGFSEPRFSDCINWYSMAIDHPDALRSLGYLYEKGLGGLAQDTQVAIKLYEKAKELGDIDSIHRLGEIYYEGTEKHVDTMRAILFYIEAAMNGCTASRDMLWNLYSKGVITRQNNSKLLKGCENLYHQSIYKAHRDYIF